MDIELVKQFLATDEGKALIENNDATNGLRTKRDELLSSNVQLKSKIDAYSALGDVDTLSKALELYKNSQETKDKTVDTNTVDPKLAAQLEHLTKELETERGIRTKREQTMINSFANAEITAAIAKHKGVPELLNHVVSGRIEAKLTDEGLVTITVKNADGSPMFKDGKEATLEHLIAEVKANPIFGRAFDADTTQGSGARTQTKTGKVAVDLDDPNVNFTELMKKQQKR